MDRPEATEMLDELQRTETVTAEEYETAISDLQSRRGPSPRAEPLQTIRRHHLEAAETLREQIRAAGATPSVAPRPRGAVLRGLTHLGERATVIALYYREQETLRDYETALREVVLPDESARFIRQQLLPRQVRHVAAMRQLLTVV